MIASNTTTDYDSTATGTATSTTHTYHQHSYDYNYPYYYTHKKEPYFFKLLDDFLLNPFKNKKQDAIPVKNIWVPSTYMNRRMVFSKSGYLPKRIRKIKKI